jgi:predicted nucleic acid-binding protein
MIVFDTSTLVLLAKLDLLQIVADNNELWIPQQVKREALAKPELYDARLIQGMIAAGSLRVSGEISVAGCRSLQGQFNLDIGEAAALLLAKKRGAAIAIDDGAAIKTAKIMGLPFLTAVRFLVEFYDRGRIDQKTALAKLDTLAKVGRYDARILGDVRSLLEKR